jgi:hypothetical protein
MRAVAENNDWDDYHAYRKQQRHLRLYGSMQANLQPIEAQSLNPQLDSHASVVKPLASHNPSVYLQMPLAF